MMSRRATSLRQSRLNSHTASLFTSSPLPQSSPAIILRDYHCADSEILGVQSSTAILLKISSCHDIRQSATYCGELRQGIHPFFRKLTVVVWIPAASPFIRCSGCRFQNQSHPVHTYPRTPLCIPLDRILGGSEGKKNKG